MNTEDVRVIAEACHTDDGIDHGRRHLEECLEAAIYKHADTALENKRMINIKYLYAGFVIAIQLSILIYFIIKR